MADAGAKYNRYPGSCADSGLTRSAASRPSTNHHGGLGVACRGMRPFGARHAVGEPTICAGDLEAAVAARASRMRPPDPRDRLPLVPFQAEFGARVGAVRQPLVGPPRRSGRGLGRLDVVGEDARQHIRGSRCRGLHRDRRRRISGRLLMRIDYRPDVRHRGASTITTWRPSKRGSCSTLASLEVSSLTRLRS
jgi:hypothetical protein